MILTVTPHELALTAARLIARIKALREPAMVRGSARYHVVRSDLERLTQEAVLMHCPTADQGQMLAAGSALLLARMTLEECPA